MGPRRGNSQRCHGTKAALQVAIDAFLYGLAERTAEVRQRYRTRLDSDADIPRHEHPEQIPHVELTRALL